MEEESDTRKINNSFLRDHNYATEGISLNVLIDGGDKEIYIEDGKKTGKRGSSWRDAHVAVINAVVII